MTEQHPFQPGAEVMLTSGYGDNRRFAPGVIEKVLKNGNLKIKGESRQFRAPHQDKDGEWTASSCWDHGVKLRAISPALLKELEAIVRMRKFRDLVYRIDALRNHINSSQVKPEHIDMLTQILEDLK